MDAEENPAVRNSYYYSTGYKPIHNKNYSFSNSQENRAFEELGSQPENHKNLDRLMLMEIQK